MSRPARVRPTATAVALSALAGALVAGGLAAAAAQVTIDDSVATLIALTMGVAVAGAGSGWLVHRRGDPTLGARLQLLGILTTAGVTRHLDLGPGGLMTAGACWLAAPVAGLWAISAVGPIAGGGVEAQPMEPGRGRTGDRPAERFLLVAACLLAAAAALAGGEAGPGSWTAVTVGAGIAPLARLLAASQAVTLVGAAVAVVGRARSAGAPSSVGVALAARLWATVAVAGTAAHLLPGRWLFEPEGYRPWAETLALKVPLVATLGLLVAVAYHRVLRPWLAPVADRVVLDLARLPSPGDGLARWTADPTVRLWLPAPGGGWLDSSGRTPMAAADVGPDRLAVTLTSGGAPVARIEHDADLAAQPGLVDYEVGLVSAILAAERDAAVAAERLAAARRANTRLLRADDDARLELRSRLAAGPVATLERLAADLGAADVSAADLAAMADRIRLVAAEVRELSHGLYPPELATGGLAAALPLVAGAPARRLPAAVEVTAYLIAAGHPGAVLDDRGARLAVTVPGPPEPRDLAMELPVERIEALGGTVRLVDGPAPGGAVRVELPTAWE